MDTTKTGLTVGKKIALGFSALILISLLLGGLCITRMKGVTAGANRLSQQYVPEVEICAELEREVLELALAMRTYGLTSEEKHLQSAEEHLRNVQAQVKKGEDLIAAHPELAKLKEDLTEFKTTLADYERLVAETRTRVAGLVKAQAEMNTAATGFVAAIETLQQSQERMLKAEIATNAPQAALEERTTKVLAVAQARTLMNQVRIAAMRAQAERDLNVVKGVQGKFAEIQAEFAKIQPLLRQAHDIKELDELVSLSKAYETATTSLISTWTALDETAARRATATEDLAKLAEDVIAVGISRTQTVAKESSDALNAASSLTTGGLVVAVVVGVFLAVVITRGISRAITGITIRLAEGAAQTSSAASQVSAASQTLAEGASEQAASLEETSASLEEMSSMTQKNTDNAAKANDLARQARTAAESGASAMQAMTKAMDDIKSSSDEVAKIIKTIDEIAFQTNILALNAAVEAARAGEAGMGFAVVADEVRALAQRSAQAAKDTAAKIEMAITRSSNGVEISGKVSQTLQEIVTSAQQVDQLVAEVAAASREQTQGITQVNTAVSQMDKVTQSNAASAEESASAAEELNAQASSLKEAVVELSRLVGAAVDGGSHAAAREHAPRGKSLVARASSVVVGGGGAKSVRNGNGRAATPVHGTAVLTAPSRATAPAHGDGFAEF